MKSYTDIEQSQKLSEILPYKSADMEYMFLKEDSSKVSNIPFIKDDDEPEWPTDSAYDFIPCWSLAALLDVLPKNLDIGRPVLVTNYRGYYWVSYFDEYMKEKFTSKIYNNPIDACYELILKLYELKIL